MKIKNLLIVPLFAALFSCVTDDQGGGNSELFDSDKIYRVPDRETMKGIVIVKLKEDAASRVAEATRNGGVATGMSELDAAIANIDATRMVRTFSHGGKYESRRRKAGLHLWYTINFDESIPFSEAAGHLAVVDDIVSVEPVLRIMPPDDGSFTTAGPEASPVTEAGDNRFNDPYLPQQWHYHNDGSLNGAVAGCDINLFPAWEITTGHPDVIVAVVDGGIDYNHPDLAQNMWTDEEGHHGYNFLTDSWELTPVSHGTFVAGIVAAVNNNGIGVCGIAGGNGSPDSGVRLMSIQASDAAGFVAAHRYGDAYAFAADNGAVIAQNSWQVGWLPDLTILPDNIREGIDYFIRYAGTDETGEVQTGPMKGGIVIFAAGNSDWAMHSMPAAYEPVFTVAACDANFKKAGYSNYGSYVETTAPGGDVNRIWSTDLHGTYRSSLGTSFAAPHISGVAALVISHIGVGNPGFTNHDLWNILCDAVLDADINAYNPDYAGMLGSGYIDVYKALSFSGSPAPAKDLWGAWRYDSADFTWTVTSNQYNQKAHAYTILISENDLTGVDFDDPPAGVRKFTVNTGDRPAGAVLRLTVDELQPGTGYYASIVTLEAYGNRSEAVMINGTTSTTKVPQAVTDLSVVCGFTDIEATWTVNGDEDGVAAVSYEILISAKEFTEEAFVNTPEYVTKATVAIGSRTIGDPLTHTFGSLE